MEKAVAIAVLVALASVGLSSATVYTVGDKAGWTTIGNVNYTAWASDKTFQIGDVILFTYNKNFHNVLVVNQDDYANCKSGSPLAIYNSGNDSITLDSKGYHYFLCGVPGHCELGQKVVILVPESSGGGAPSPSPGAAPSPSSPPSSGGGGSTPGVSPSPSIAPTSSGAPATAPSKIAGLVLAVLPFAAAFGGLIMMPW